ncbi:MAG: nitroreductase family deazaflavin-dependent oxidoreductase [Streptosporangiales bacterium]|nr:nitroreductase family deazaflavin-dependent oxidoreductase [Streptosporangiales bacterium]
MEILERPQRPSGLRRLLWRLPIQLYRLRLGWLLGGRFMLLTHTGRISGKRRQAVVEVVDHSADDGSYTAASGFGPRADWYQNVLKTPEVTIEVGRRTMPATGAPLTADEGAETMARYAPRHPTAAKALCRVMGFTVDGTEADYRAAGRRIPFLRFTRAALPLPKEPERRVRTGQVRAAG